MNFKYLWDLFVSYYYHVATPCCHRR